jgi:hypothetical protein
VRAQRLTMCRLKNAACEGDISCCRVNCALHETGGEFTRLDNINKVRRMQTSTIKPPTWYWVVSVLALIWMLFGVFAWTMDFLMDEAALAQMTDAQRQLYSVRPQWLFIVYAIAIFSGLAGAIGLVMRKAWAIPAFWISLIAIIIQFGYTLLVMDAIRLLGAAAALPFPIVIFAIGVALLWFAIRAKKSGWLA